MGATLRDGAPDVDDVARCSSEIVRYRELLGWDMSEFSFFANPTDFENMN